jgi:hypothetical protein
MPRTKKRRGRPSTVSRLSVADLMREVERRRGMAGELRSRQEGIERQLQAVNNEIAELEALGSANDHAPGLGRGRPKGSGRGKRRGARAGKGRGGNEKSLPALLHGLLRGKTMSVPDMAEAAKKAGHKSKSKNFRTIVSLALLNNKNMFKRVSRGQYTAR